MEIKMNSVVEIILCTSCNGKGTLTRDVLTDYHKREYVTHVTDCMNCNGTGRLKKITTVTYEKFVKPALGIF